MRYRTRRPLGALLFLGISLPMLGIKEGNLGYFLLGIGMLAWGVSIIVSIVKRY